MKLRNYQEQGMNEIRAHMLAGEKRVLYVLPTGGGKTVVVAHMIKSAAARGKRIWFVLHRQELLMQSIRAFHQVGVKHGIVASGMDVGADNPVQIVSVQTMAKRIGKYKAPDLIIIDEGHHAVAGSWSKIFDNYPRAHYVLVTATPERLDGKGLKGYADQMVIGPSVSELIQLGYLSDYKAYAPSKIDTKGLKKTAGDFQKKELGIRAKVITGDAVQEYKTKCMGKRAISFCASIDHSMHVVSEFNAAGIPAAHVDGKTPKDVRAKRIKQFKEGKIHVLSNVELFGEGFDIPAIEAVILLRPTESLSLHLQQVGRALRPADGKSHAIILDHAGNIEKHGLPDEPRLWSLDGKKERIKNEKETNTRVRMCPNCFAFLRASSGRCSECGSEEIIKRDMQIIQEEAELQELELNKIREKWLARRERSEIQSYEDAVEFGKRRGYKPGWAKVYWQNCRRNRK